MARTIGGERAHMAAGRRPWGLTIGGTWVLAVLALLYIFNALVPQPPNDFWWHMAAGRLIAQTGAVPTTNLWAYTLPADAPYYYQSWLGSYTMYALWRVGDVPLVLFGRTLVVVLSYGLLAWHATRRAGSERAAALALLVGALLGAGNWFMRPQTLALLPFALIVVICGEYRAGRLRPAWLLALAPTMALWVNLHGSFVAGLVVIGVTTFGELLRLAARRPSALRPRRWAYLALAALLAALATLLNPRGALVFPYLQTMLDNPALQRYFLEWQPPTNAPGNFIGVCFFGALLGTTALLARSPRRAGLTDLLLFGAFAWLAIDGIRYVIWFGMLLVPLLAEHLAAVGAQIAPRRTPERPSPLLARVVGGSLAALALLLLPWVEPAARLGPGFATGLATNGPYRSLLSSTHPVAATEWLRRNPVDGRFFTDMSYSSYTIWALPEKQVFADLRVELFPEAIWRDYFAIAGGTPEGVATRERWGITHMLIDRTMQRRLVAQLEGDPAWRRVYEDRDAVIFVRADATP